MKRVFTLSKELVRHTLSTFIFIFLNQYSYINGIYVEDLIQLLKN